WPEDAYGDFDNSINNSIRKLRDALGDDADSPRFIETLPRRGYRFIAPVSHASPGLPSSPVSQIDTNVNPIKSRRRHLWAFVTAALIALGAGFAFWWSDSRSKTEAVNALLTVVPFTTHPGWENLPSFSADGTRIAFSWQ